MLNDSTGPIERGIIRQYRDGCEEETASVFPSRLLPSTAERIVAAIHRFAAPTYTPAATVLDDLTDAALQSEHSRYGNAAIQELLRVPAEYRQAVEAEVMRRSTRVVYARSGVNRMQMEAIASPSLARRQVVGEVLQQLSHHTAEHTVPRPAEQKD
jgi:hypothetical protein